MTKFVQEVCGLYTFEGLKNKKSTNIFQKNVSAKHYLRCQITLIIKYLGATITAICQ